MKLRKLMAMAAALCLCGAMVGCGDSGNTDSSSKKEETSSSAQSEDKEITEDNGDDSEEKDEKSEEKKEEEAEYDFSFPTELSDDLFDYQIQVGDEIVSVPSSLRDFYDAGWTVKQEERNIYGNGTEDVDLIKDGKLISVTLYNFGDKLITIQDDENAKDLKIISILCSNMYNEGEVRVANGIVVGTATKDDIKAAFGDPDDEVRSGNFDQYMYNEDRISYGYTEPLEYSKNQVPRYVQFNFAKNDDGIVTCWNVYIGYTKENYE